MVERRTGKSERRRRSEPRRRSNREAPAAPESAIARYRRLMPYIMKQWRWLLAIVALTIFSSLTAALGPWPMKILVDHALGDADVPPRLSSLLTGVGLASTAPVLILASGIATVGIFAIEAFLSYALSLSWAAGGRRMVFALGADVFAALQRLSLLFHSKRRIGDSLSRLSGDTWCIYTVADGLLIGPIKRIATLVTMAIVGFSLDPVLGGLAVAVAPLLGASSRFFGKRMKARAKLGREAASRIASFVHQTLAAVPVVQSFATEDRNRESFSVLADEAVERAQQGRLVSGAYGLVNGFILAAGAAVVLYVGGLRVLSGSISLGTLLVFVSYSRQMQRSAGGLFTVFAKLKTAEVSIDRLLEILESDQKVAEAPDARRLRPPAQGRPGHVVLENVVFGYEPGRPVLLDVSLEARPGELIALVGPTGAGKSTTASLILRFFDPWQGRVLFDGNDLRELTLESLRASISFVPQEPYLLPLSIAENIAYARAGATREEIVEAARAAGADDFIRRLPDSYDTIIGERGASLSGGERQRLAIARALLRNAPVLILDEPTSALDAQTENDLIETLERVKSERSTFVIAHRLSLVQHADRIAALRDGRVVEVGRHQELLARRGLYHSLYTAQHPTIAREVVA